MVLTFVIPVPLRNLRRKRPPPRCPIPSASTPPPPPPSSDSSPDDKQWSILSERISNLREQHVARNQQLAHNWRTGNFTPICALALSDEYTRTLAFQGDHLLCGTSKGATLFGHFPTGAVLRAELHDGPVSATAYANGVIASAGLRDRCVLVWKSPALERLRTWDVDDQGVGDFPPPIAQLHGHNDTITCIVIGPRGIIYSGSTDGSIRVYTTDAELSHVIHVGDPVHALVLTEAGYILAACASGNVHAYQASRGLFLLSVRAHERLATAVAFDDDTQMLATGDSSGVVKIWALEESRCCAEAHVHNDAIMSLQMDGAKVVSGGRDGFVTVSTADTLKRLYSIGGFTKYIRSVAFDEARLMADGSNDLIICYHFDAELDSPDDIDSPDD